MSRAIFDKLVKRQEIKRDDVDVLFRGMYAEPWTRPDARRCRYDPTSLLPITHTFISDVAFPYKSLLFEPANNSPQTIAGGFNVDEGEGWNLLKTSMVNRLSRPLSAFRAN
jgi:hypothetical protein